MPSSFSKLLGRFSPLVCSRKNTARLIFSALTTVAKLAIDLGIPYVFNEVLTALFEQNKPGIIDISPLAKVGAYVTVSWVISPILVDLQRTAVTTISTNVGLQFCGEFVDHLFNLPIDYHQTTPPGINLELLTKSLSASKEFVNLMYTEICPTSMQILAVIGILAYRGNYLVGIGLGGMFITSTAYSLVTAKSISKGNQERMEAAIKTMEQMSAILPQYVTATSFNNISHEAAELKVTLNEFSTKGASIDYTIDRIGMGQSLILGAGAASILIPIAKEVLDGKYPISSFILILQFLQQLIPPTKRFADAVNKMRGVVVDLGMVTDFFARHPRTVELYSDRSLKTEQKTDIIFTDVHFSYPGKDPLLTGLSFTAEEGKRTALVGDSGAGKSTIIGLLLRLHEITQGSITISGQDISTVSKNSLRSKISVIPQSPTLFNKTLEYNIRYSMLSSEEKISKEEILRVAREAGLGKLIDEQKKGLGMMVGVNGDKISGGEKQRVAIARALLKKAPVVLIDEGTASLDTKTESAVQKSLDTALKGSTTIAIAHRLHTIMNFDKIIVIQNGKKVEEGTHAELLEQSGAYANLWQEQAKHFVPVPADTKGDKKGDEKKDDKRGSEERNSDAGTRLRHDSPLIMSRSSPAEESSSSVEVNIAPTFEEGVVKERDKAKSSKKPDLRTPLLPKSSSIQTEGPTTTHPGSRDTGRCVIS